MALQKIEKKRKRSRKARTEVSSSSSSSDSESITPQQPLQTERERIRDDSVSLQPASHQETQSPSDAVSEDEQLPAVPKSKQHSLNPQQAFEAFYLQQATREFAEDLEKLRSAPDFHDERSVPVLIEALRQGTACFGAEERQKIAGMAPQTEAVRRD